MFLYLIFFTGCKFSLLEKTFTGLGLGLLKMILPIKSETQLIFLHVLCHQILCPFLYSAHIFCSLPLAAYISVEALFVLIHCLQIELQVEFGFP